MLRHSETILFRQIEHLKPNGRIPSWLLEFFELKRSICTVNLERRQGAQDMFTLFQRDSRLASRPEALRKKFHSRVREVLEDVLGYHEASLKYLLILHKEFRQDFPIVILELILYHGVFSLEKEYSLPDSVVNEVSDLVIRFCHTVCDDANLTGLRSFPEDSTSLDDCVREFRAEIGARLGG